MMARTLQEAEAEFYLGDMLLHDNRFSDAESHLKTALRLDPNLAVAQASMGRLLVQQNKDTDAIAYLRRAIQLDPGVPPITHALRCRENGAPYDAGWVSLERSCSGSKLSTVHRQQSCSRI
jgi:predicted Zn-dependent protease